MTIRISDLSIETVIGILDFERLNPQRVSITCEIGYDGVYVDYGAIRELLIYRMREGAFLLIEDALAVLLPEIKAAFPQITSVRLAIGKPDIFSDCVVSVEKYEQF
jgi:dihydroneopterin aldolase